jgi:hypothetical protein
MNFLFKNDKGIEKNRLCRRKYFIKELLTLVVISLIRKCVLCINRKD